jgi:hypothetical protein
MKIVRKLLAGAAILGMAFLCGNLSGNQASLSITGRVLRSRSKSLSACPALAVAGVAGVEKCIV